MNINVVLILIWVLLSAVLVIENMVIPLPAYVLVWSSQGRMLSILSICTWIIIWYGIRWYSATKKKDDYSDNENFDF